MVSDVFHVDPLNLIVVIAGIIVMWSTLRNDSKWHTTWIRKHDDECGQRDEKTTAILVALEKSNAHLVTLTDGHHDRMNKIDDEIIRLRDRTHGLANTIQGRM